MPLITRKNRNYTKDQKINALEILHSVHMNYDEAVRQTGVSENTLKSWVWSDWGKLKLAEFNIRDNSAAVNSGLQSIIDTKLDHIQHQFKFFTELEDLMNECITQYKNLIPVSTKLQDVNESFKVISDVYLKGLALLNNNKEYKPGDKKSDMESFIVNVIDKQLVVRPESVQELLNGK